MWEVSGLGKSRSATKKLEISNKVLFPRETITKQEMKPKISFAIIVGKTNGAVGKNLNHILFIWPKRGKHSTNRNPHCREIGRNLSIFVTAPSVSATELSVHNWSWLIYTYPLLLGPHSVIGLGYFCSVGGLISTVAACQALEMEFDIFLLDYEPLLRRSGSIVAIRRCL